jgi:HK97 family phage major capsid protein
MDAKLLAENRALTVKKMRALADKCKDETKEWRKEDAEEWEQLNATFDAQTRDLDRVLDRRTSFPATSTKAERMQAVEGIMDTPLGDPRIGREDRGGPSFGDGPRFVDPQGREVRALKHTERIGQHVDLLEGEARDLPLGELLRGLLTGRADMGAGEVRGMVGGLDPSGGYLLTPQASGLVVDLARSASVVLKAGALTLPMTGAELQIARVAQDPVSIWRHEGVEVPASDILFDRITLRPRTLACILPVTLELLEDASNSAAVIEEVLRASMGAVLDKAVLVGQGNNAEPRGIRNHPAANTVTSVGTPSDYSKYSSAVEKILTANFPGDASALAWIGHPRDFARLDVLEDSTGQPLNPTPWTMALRKFSTTSLPVTEGGGNNESVAIIGSFPEVVVGMRTSGVRIRVLESGTVTDGSGIVHSAAAELKKLVVAYLRADVGVLRPNWFTVLSGITVSYETP